MRTLFKSLLLGLAASVVLATPAGLLEKLADFTFPSNIERWLER